MQDPLFSSFDWEGLRSGKLPDGLANPPLVLQPDDRYDRVKHGNGWSGMDLLRAVEDESQPIHVGSHRAPVSFGSFDDWVSPAVLQDGALPGFAHGTLIFGQEGEPGGRGVPNCNA